MSKTKLILGLLIIAALITAGCTGTKTTVGNDKFPAAGQTAALDTYTKNARELSDEINFIQNHYPLSPNATAEEYRAWLTGYGEKLDLCRQMYNNTSIAAKNYLGYLNSSSPEYGNVTAADAAYADDIEQLNRTYGNHTANLDLTIKKMTAMGNYSDRLNDTMGAYSALTELAKDAKVDSMGSYAKYVDNFKDKATVYAERADEAIAAGDEYAGYCDPGSAEYKAVQDNNNALRDGVKKCWETYENYKKDYESKAGAAGAMQSIFQNYVDKMGVVASTKQALDTYRASKTGPAKLDKSWLDGYKPKIDAFNAACNDAIAAGNACERYLDPSGAEYKGVEANKKGMQDYMAECNENYNTLYRNYMNLHPLGSLLK